MKRLLIIGTALLIAGTTWAQSSMNKSLELTRPSEGAIISNNMPELTWQAMDGHTYEVWIDGIKRVAGISKNWFIPFPLSYGKHLWEVRAIGADGKIASESSSFTIDGAPLSSLPDNAVLLRKDWKVISSLLEGNGGSVLSKKKIKSDRWKSTSLPATVLSVMVRNGLYPNPYLGKNNMRIPDLSDEFNDKYGLLQYSHIEGKNPWQAPYWYHKTFRIPDGYAGKKIWLTLGEINYRAEVWLNGELLADTTEVVGMERFFRFDISALAKLKGSNTLAIAIYPPDHPGVPADAPITPLAPPGLNMADGMISKDYTKWDVLGWDWIPAVRDRDMGITGDVFIHASDALELENLYVSTDLPLPSTNFADLCISTDLVNHSSEIMEGTLIATITGNRHHIELEQPFSLEANDTLSFLWDPSNIPQLHLKNPELWWPLGYGDPALYTLSLEAVSTKAKVQKEIRFGIREVETYMGANERVYKINGTEIYCKGGNWVMDMMLNWTADRYEKEILMTKHANLNMLRVWGPTGAPPDVLYELADQYGIMMWQDFLNDFWGTFKNTPGMSPERSLFAKATIQMVKKYRNHPSLVIWCGGNEGPNPKEELIMNTILPKYDGRDSKHYLKISNGDGLHGGGPYHTILPELYFSEPKLSGFSSEIGPSGVPEFESVKRFMPDAGKEAWKAGRFPLDGTWAYHDAINFSGSDKRKFSHYDDIIRNSYGAPDSTLAGVENYLDKCQLLNHDVYRACLEAINSQLWANSSGLLLWKSNSAWPSMVWQVYDWYLQAHAGFYGTRKSAAPNYVQYNRKSQKIEILNASLNTLEHCKITAVLYDSSLEKIWESSETLDLDENSVYELDEKVPIPAEVSFLKLEMKNEAGEIITDNFYWLSAVNDFTSFNELPEPDLEIETKKNTGADNSSYTVKISNRGESLALMCVLKLVDPVSGLEILPSYWSDNYLSLLPGETKVVQVDTGTDNLPEEVVLTHKAFNTKKAKTTNLK